MIDKSIVSCKVAQLAKTKGFNLLVTKFFTKDGELILNEKESFDECQYYFDVEDFEENYNMSNTHVILNNKKAVVCSAPTQSELQKWLRNEHNIHILMNVGIYDGEKQTFYCNVIMFGYNKYKSKFRSKTSVYTFEEALEMGLEEALKLIK
jgi:hypothetical protein